MTRRRQTQALRRRLLQVLATTAGLWGLGAQVQVRGDAPPPVRVADMVRRPDNSK